MIWFKTSFVGAIQKTVALQPSCNALFTSFLRAQAVNDRMSGKVVNRLVYYGRKIVQSIRDKHCNITHNIKGDITANVKDKGLLNATESLTQEACQRPLFINHLLKWAKNSAAAEIRRNTAKKIIYGGRNVVPYLGFVGINLISGQGLVTKEDEIEKVCEDIRISLKNDHKSLENDNKSSFTININDLEIGEFIDKGCNAVVHAGRWKNKLDDLEDIKSKEKEMSTDENLQDELKLKHTKFLEKFNTFNLAVKMMFNYDAESNAFAILKAMHRETLPAKYIIGDMAMGDINPFKNYSLPPHPNIVTMHCAFTDRTPLLPEATKNYPDALPYRLNRDGSGRNMTLFLVMKRYHCNLREYLKYYIPSPTTRLCLFTQLLEAILFLSQNGVAHRDLKADNILLDLSHDPEMPILVITDFGNAFVNSKLKLPFPCAEIERGGNCALMAPEVRSAIPGPFSFIDYNKSDLWTTATLAYEIFGEQNPFYSSNKNNNLQSHLYSEDQLPHLPNVSKPLTLLIQDMLKRDPNERPSPAVAANVCHLLMWGPSWLQCINATSFSKEKLIEWLVTEAAASILQNSFGTTLWMMMRNMFLSRIRMKEVESAIEYFF